jgi:hypothetical protein
MASSATAALRRKKQRDALLQAVRTQLLPLFLRNGFTVAPLTNDREPVDRELIASHPLGRLRRWREDGSGVDLVEINFSRDRRAFRLQAGVAPAQGVRGYLGVCPAEDALVGWLDQFFEMYASPTWRRWFKVRRWPWGPAPRHEDYEKLARDVGNLLPEVEAALRDGHVGPHIRRVVLGPRVPERYVANER